MGQWVLWEIDELNGNCCCALENFQPPSVWGTLVRPFGTIPILFTYTSIQQRVYQQSAQLKKKKEYSVPCFHLCETAKSLLKKKMNSLWFYWMSLMISLSKSRDAHRIRGGESLCCTYKNIHSARMYVYTYNEQPKWSRVPLHSHG
jgi:hypothetical protein